MNKAPFKLLFFIFNSIYFTKNTNGRNFTKLQYAGIWRISCWSNQLFCFILLIFIFLFKILKIKLDKKIKNNKFKNKKKIKILRFFEFFLDKFGNSYFGASRQAVTFLVSFDATFKIVSIEIYSSPIRTFWAKLWWLFKKC